MEDTLKVVFRPARNGTGVICRLPSGKVVFPSRLYWNEPPPQPFELWLVRPCGETASVGYVKPIQRLAEAPFRDTRTANSAIACCGGSVAFWLHWLDWRTGRPAVRRAPQNRRTGIHSPFLVLSGRG